MAVCAGSSREPDWLGLAHADLDFELQCSPAVRARDTHENAGIQPVLASGLPSCRMQSRAL